MELRGGVASPMRTSLFRIHEGSFMGQGSATWPGLRNGVLWKSDG